MSVTRYLGGRSKGVEIEIGEVKGGVTDDWGKALGVVMLVVWILFTIYLVLRGR